MLEHLDQRAVGERILADHLRLVSDIRVVAEQPDLDLGRFFDDVVVREDEAVAADDEPGARRPRGLLALTPAAVALSALLTRFILLPRLAEKAVEQIVRRSAAEE